MREQDTPSAPALQDTYREFLERKSQVGSACGFEPPWLPDYLKPFQRHLDEWAIRRGRTLCLADCGLGKGPMLLVWSENVVRHTNRPVLVVTTLGDSDQMVREAAKFQVDAVRVKDGKVPSGGAKVVITNYERLHLFGSADFSGVAANESSILKSFAGKRKAEVLEFMRTTPYRSLWTATAAPNDWDELGNSAEAIGELGYQDMLTKFFTKQFADRAGLGWGQTKIRLRGYAERDFWRWVASWARACRKPSDLGFDDAGYDLPPLTVTEHVVNPRTKPAGFLFEMPAVTLEEQRDEMRRTLTERCELAAGLVAAHADPSVSWCHLNPEGDLLAKLIPGAVQVAGADSDDEKEEKILAFVTGQIKKLVSKPKICGYGQNWQHCAHQTYFVSHSWEQWYQVVRRSWRFGQENPVGVDVISTPGTEGIQVNLNRKQDQAERMFARMIESMHDEMTVNRYAYGTQNMEAPAWL